MVRTMDGITPIASIGRMARRAAAWGTLSILAPTVAAAPAAAQYVLEAPSGEQLTFTSDELRAMLDTTRALYRNLEEDPRVMYLLGFGEGDAEMPAEQTYPWNSVAPESDSVATIITPGNLREGSRAYYNYAVELMQYVRYGDPDVSCDSLMALAENAVSSFANGWIVSRTLFGGVAFAALDEIAFAREAGVLKGMIAATQDGHVGACAEMWAEENPDQIQTYRAWRVASFLEPEDASEDAGEEQPAVLPGLSPTDDDGI